MKPPAPVTTTVLPSNRTNPPVKELDEQAREGDRGQYDANESPHIQRYNERKTEVHAISERDGEGDEGRGDEQPDSEAKPVAMEGVHREGTPRVRRIDTRERGPNTWRHCSTVTRQRAARPGAAKIVIGM